MPYNVGQLAGFDGFKREKFAIDVSQTFGSIVIQAPVWLLAWQRWNKDSHVQVRVAANNPLDRRLDIRVSRNNAHRITSSIDSVRDKFNGYVDVRFLFLLERVPLITNTALYLALLELPEFNLDQRQCFQRIEVTDLA